MARYKPRWAIMKPVSSSANRLVLFYHPLAYLLLSGLFLLICLWAAYRQATQGNWGDVALIMSFGLVLFAGFGGFFYRKVRLTLDRTTGQIMHRKTIFFRTSTQSYPLAELQQATVDTSYSGDTPMHRTVLQFHSRDPVPVTQAYLSGPNGIEVAEWINEWLASGAPKTP